MQRFLEADLLTPMKTTTRKVEPKTYFLSRGTITRPGYTETVKIGPKIDVVTDMAEVNKRIPEIQKRVDELIQKYNPNVIKVTGDAPTDSRQYLIQRVTEVVQRLNSSHVTPGKTQIVRVSPQQEILVTVTRPTAKTNRMRQLKLILRSSTEGFSAYQFDLYQYPYKYESFMSYERLEQPEVLKLELASPEEIQARINYILLQVMDEKLPLDDAIQIFDDLLEGLQDIQDQLDPSFIKNIQDIRQDLVKLKKELPSTKQQSSTLKSTLESNYLWIILGVVFLLVILFFYFNSSTY